MMTIRIFLLGALVVLFSQGVFADEQDKEKRALAEELHKVWGMEEQINDMMLSISKQLPSENQQAFLNQMAQIIDFNEVASISISAAYQVFSEEEMKYMIAYYGSELGKTVEQKRLDYNKVITPQIKQMIDKGIADASVGMKSQNAPMESGQ